MATATLLCAAACGPASSVTTVDLPERAAGSQSAPTEVATDPLSPEALLASLPRGAAAYVAVRAVDFDPPLQALWGLGLRDSSAGRFFGDAEGIGALLEELRVDPTRPMVLAASEPAGGDAAEILRVIDPETRWQGPEPSLASVSPIASTYRVVLPLEPGGDDLAGLRALFTRIRITTAACPGDPRCRRFGEERPTMLAYRAPWIGAVFLRGASAELELARLRLWSSDESAAWELLAASRRATRGGPEPGRCATVDLSTSAWVCVDADRFAAFATAEGNLALADALAGSGMALGVGSDVGRVGRAEIARIMELARPGRALLEAGSASLRVTGLRYMIDARWRASELARADVERALGARRCAGIGDPAPFFEGLRAAFPDPGPGFADPAANRERLLEAGWGGQGVAFARSWPNLLNLAPGDLRQLGLELGVGEACAAHESGALHLGLRGRLPWEGKR